MGKIRFPTLILLAIVAILGFQVWKRNRPLPPTSVEWWSNYDLAAEYARKNGKPLLIEFYADW